MKRRDKKEALKIIQTRLEEGKPRKEILEELSGIYNEKSSVAELIAMTPDNRTKEKYRLLNYILLLCLFLALIGEMYSGFLLFAEKPIEAVIVSFIVFVIVIAVIIEVSKFKGYIYGLLTFLALVGLINDLTRISKFETGDFIGIFLVLAFACLAFYLNKKMFPNYGFFGLKKDKNGEYLLE